MSIASPELGRRTARRLAPPVSARYRAPAELAARVPVPVRCKPDSVCGGNRSDRRPDEDRPQLQTMLEIGAPDDEYEREADLVANRVQRVCACGGGCPRCWTKQSKLECVQNNRVSGEIAEVTPNVKERINALEGGGQPLPDSEQVFFQRRFGHDFTQVRVHADDTAATLARAVSARAFTYGDQVVFGAGEYSPGTASGRRLLAHELTHVVQQQAEGSLIQRKIAFSKNPDVSIKDSAVKDLHEEYCALWNNFEAFVGNLIHQGNRSDEFVELYQTLDRLPSTVELRLGWIGNQWLMQYHSDTEPLKIVIDWWKIGFTYNDDSLVALLGHEISHAVEHHTHPRRWEKSQEQKRKLEEPRRDLSPEEIHDRAREERRVAPIQNQIRDELKANPTVSDVRIQSPPSRMTGFWCTDLLE